jgi:NADH-quinone oxidoreductase subunit L
MFLALGVGSYTGAMFHFMTHAFFKALLFLGAGVLGHCLHHEYNMYNMGGVKKQIPFLFNIFLIGSLALAAIPFLSSGFFSKDFILWEALISDRGGVTLWLGGLLGAMITGYYTFRMFFITFFSTPRAHDHTEHLPGLRMKIPLSILALLALIAGYLETPHTLGHITLFSSRLSSVLPLASLNHDGSISEAMAQIFAVLVTFIGILVAYIRFYKTPFTKERALSPPKVSTLKLRELIEKGWGFDSVYDLLFVRPYTTYAQVLKKDIVNLFNSICIITAQFFHNILIETQNGKMQTYFVGMLLGVITILSMAVLS